MRLHRFYVNKPLGEEIVVDGSGEGKELVHQWTHVFRLKSGDEVFLFSENPSGKDFLYRFSSLSKNEAALEPVSASPNILPTRDITLVMALVKKDTFETIVRQATELGVTHIIPLIAGRSEKKNLNFDRLRTISIEAAEQCGRGTTPVITPIYSFNEACEETSTQENVVGSLHGEKGNSFGRDSVALWVGPEGGWTEEEEKTMKEKGFRFYKLTDTVLKADTAAVALLSAIQS